MTEMHGEVVLLPAVAEDQPRLLLDAWIRGRYAAQVGFRTDNPYRDDNRMAAAWQQGWDGVDTPENERQPAGATPAPDRPTA